MLSNGLPRQGLQSDAEAGSSVAPSDVCLVTAQQGHLADRFLNIAASLARHGHAVHVYGVNRRDDVAILQGYPFPVTLLPNPAKAMHRDKAYFGPDRSMNIEEYVARLAAAFRKSLPAGPLDLLFTHDMLALGMGALLHSPHSRNSPWAWIHDMPRLARLCQNLPENLRKTCLAYERQYLHTPKALLTTSPQLAEAISVSYGLPQAPRYALDAPLLANFRQDSARTLRAEAALDIDTRLVVYSGPVNPEYDLECMVRALPHLPDTHFALMAKPGVGYVQALLDLAATLDVVSQIHILEPVPSNQVSTFIQSANAAVSTVPAQRNADLALERHLFDALHAGLPLICSGTKAQQALIDKYKCGVTFTPGSPDALALALDQANVRFPSGLPNAGAGSELARIFCWEKQEQQLTLVSQPQDRFQTKNRPPKKRTTLQETLLNNFYISHQKLGQSHLHRKSLDEAFTSYQQALALNPKDIASIDGLSKIVQVEYNSLKISLLQQSLDKLLTVTGTNRDCFHLSSLVSIVNQRIMRSKRSDEQWLSVTDPAGTYRINNDRPRLLLLTCVWKRPELTSIVLSYYRDLQGRLDSRLDLQLLAVGSEGRTSETLCREAGFDYLEYPNEPLSDKWEAGIRWCREYDPDGVVIVGSDDLVTENIFQRYADCLMAGDLFVGLKDGYFLDHAGNTMVHWHGYGGSAKERGQPHRLLETTGMARLLARPLLDALDFSIWQGVSLNKGLDAHMKNRIKNLGLLPVRYIDRLVCTNSNGQACCLGQSALNMAEMGGIAVDIKHNISVTPFSNFTRSPSSYTPVSTPWDFLKQHFPKQTIDKLLTLPKVQ